MLARKVQPEGVRGGGARNLGHDGGLANVAVALPNEFALKMPGHREMGSSALGLESVTTQEDIASVAAQLAELTRTVEAMAKDLHAMTERADRQQARADSQQDLVDSQQKRAQVQQERIDLAARELADVSDRLQAAANALRDSV